MKSISRERLAPAPLSWSTIEYASNETLLRQEKDIKERKKKNLQYGNIMAGILWTGVEIKRGGIQVSSGKHGQR
jgi:hypothetical protein